MTPLLFLVHRIPYPPNKGDKVRSFHLLKAMSKYFDIHLGAFVDDPNDWQYQNKLKQLSKEVMLLPLNPSRAKLRSLKGLLTNEALSVTYYRDKGMQKWVERTINDKHIQHVLIYSSVMAQYVNKDYMVFKKRIADFVDIDSDKWRQYSKNCDYPMKWIYQREANKLLNYEKTISRSFDATLFVSEAEKKDFDECIPDSIERHGFYNNGVDYKYFDPQKEFSNPYADDINAITFTGAMDYWANADAVKWFVDEVFPLVRKAHPQARFYIVGSNPSKEVLALARLEGVIVTGSVIDIRSYISCARLIVAPMRIARGIQNKVLEAMAMARPLVATSLALEGIEQCSNYSPTQADLPEVFAEKCIEILGSEGNINEPQARQCIKDNYDWDNNLDVVLNLFREVEQV